MTFCREHAFYDCKVCKGEEPLWVIPVLENGVEVGELSIHEGQFSDTSSYVIGEGVVFPEEGVVLSESPAEVFQHIPPQPEPARIDLVAFLESVPKSPDPAYDQARERGRVIYEEALKLAEETGAALFDCIVKLGEESLREGA